jgi:hypothetical protein
MSVAVDTRPSFTVPSPPMSHGTSTAPPALPRRLLDAWLVTESDILQTAISHAISSRANIVVVDTEDLVMDLNSALTNIIYVDSARSGLSGGADEASSVGDVIERWINATKFSSSLDESRRDPRFTSLKQLGWAAVPALLARVSEGRARLQCAELLAEITGDDPVTDADLGNAKKIGEAWMRWARSRSLA